MRYVLYEPSLELGKVLLPDDGARRLLMTSAGAYAGDGCLHEAVEVKETGLIPR